MSSSEDKALVYPGVLNIGKVTFDPQLPVNTSWNFGITNNVSIIFFQVSGQAINVIDSYEVDGKGLVHCISVLKEKPYNYGTYIAPSYIKIYEEKTTSSGKASFSEITFDLADKIGIMDEIEMVRNTLPRMWFDEEKNTSLIKAIGNYSTKADCPQSDEYTSFADSLRYLCVYLPKLIEDEEGQE